MRCGAAVSWTPGVTSATSRNMATPICCKAEDEQEAAVMIANAQRMFNFDLGETADAIRDTVAGFSQNEIAPRAAEIDRKSVV